MARSTARWTQYVAGLVDERTAIGLVSLILLSVGCGLIFAPLALIVPGALLFWIFAWPSIRKVGS